MEVNTFLLLLPSKAETCLAICSMMGAIEKMNFDVGDMMGFWRGMMK